MAPRSGRGFKPGRRPPAGAGAGAGQHKSLDALGPLPKRPSIYPAGAEVSRVPVTFEIELIDEAFKKPAPPEQAALERTPQEPAT